MKTYTYQDTLTFLKNGKDIAPTKPKLWERTNNIFILQSKEGMIEYYEKLGGRWKVISENKKSVKVQSQIVENVQPLQTEKRELIYGITDEDYEIIRSIKEYDPESYRRMRNWD